MNEQTLSGISGALATKGKAKDEGLVAMTSTVGDLSESAVSICRCTVGWTVCYKGRSSARQDGTKDVSLSGADIY